jgi:lysophospholipase L1-like esterase
VKRFRVLCVVLVLALLLTPATALAASKHAVVYTALGDSIAAGTGGTGSVGYTDLLAKRLARGKRHVAFNDLGVNGMTSGDLLAAVSTVPAFQVAVAKADIITVSIGGNDLLQPVLGFLAANPQYADPMFRASLTPEEQMALAVQMNALLQPGVVAFSTNWPYTIGAINALNPKADVYVNTLYNPFTPGDGLFELLDPYVRGINGVIVAAAPYADYTVVDVYAKFAAYTNLSKPLVHGLTSPVALHPTDKGYKVIFEMHKKLLQKKHY